MEKLVDVFYVMRGEKSGIDLSVEETHFFVDKAVQDGHQETLWRQRQPILSQSPKLTHHSYNVNSHIILTSHCLQIRKHDSDAT